MRISDWSSDVCSSDLQVGDPGHASERALLRVDQLTGRPVVAAGLAQPARTAAAELAGSTGTAVVIGPAHAERGDRAAGARGQRAADGPHVVELVAAPHLDLVAGVVEGGTEALVHGDRKSTRLNSSH